MGEIDQLAKELGLETAGKKPTVLPPKGWNTTTSIPAVNRKMYQPIWVKTTGGTPTWKALAWQKKSGWTAHK